MVPISHVLWSHLWLGIATDAFDRSRAFVRAAAKRTPGVMPPAATKLSHVMGDLQLLRGEVKAGLADYVEHFDDAEWLMTMAAALRFNNLKIAASEQVSRICQGAMSVSGIVGFKNDTPFAVGRPLRELDVGLPDDRQRPHSFDERRPAPHRQGGLRPWPTSAKVRPRSPPSSPSLSARVW